MTDEAFFWVEESMKDTENEDELEDVACPVCDEGQYEDSCEICFGTGVVWEDDEDGEPMSMKDYQAELKDRGIDTRQWDEAYIQVRDWKYCVRPHNTRVLHDADTAYFKKSTLADISRIERLRWQACLNYQKHWDRQAKLNDEIDAMDDHEAFISPECYDIWSTAKELQEQCIEDRTPRRIVIEDDNRSFGSWLRYDDRFWNYEEPEHSGTDMEVIAAAAALGEWEQIILPARIAAVSEEKLELGRRYFYENTIRGNRLSNHCRRLNNLLFLSLTTTGILPTHNFMVEKLAKVWINGRLYMLNVKRSDYVDQVFELWPKPHDLPEVTIPSSFDLDDSLVGLTRENVRTRLGEPVERTKNGIWHYPDGEIEFDGNDSYHSRVKKVRHLQTAVSSSE